MEHRPVDATTATMGGFWDGRAEPAEAIARRTALTLQRLEVLCPVDGWRYPNGNEWGMWPTGAQEQADWVESQISRSEDGDPQPEYGYFLLLSQEVDGCHVKLTIMAGGSAQGGRVPTNRVSVVVEETAPGAFPATVVDLVLEAVVEVWEPLTATCQNRAVLDVARPTSPWQALWGYRTWVHDSVGPISQVAPGVLVARVGEGTLLSAPDEWTVPRVVEAIRESLSMNGIDELSH